MPISIRWTAGNDDEPQAKIPEFKACAVQVFLAREEDLSNPEVEVRRGRY